MSAESSVPPFEKCAIVIDGGLPAGLAMNAAAVLAFSLGDVYGGSVLGPDIKDRDGTVHRAITAAPIPILRSDAEALRVLASRVDDDPQLYLVDFTAVAQAARDYDDYASRMAQAGAQDHAYVGLAIAGAKKAVNKVSGSMPLFR